MDAQKITYEYQEKIDRIERHFKEFKEEYRDDNTSMSKDVGFIKNALVGSDMNGNKGIVQQVDKIELIEKKLEVIYVYLDQIKIIVGGIVVALISSFVIYIFK